MSNEAQAVRAQPIADILHDLKGLHAQSTPGVWGKGATTHHTVSRNPDAEPYRVAEFRHAKDAEFCDFSHNFMPQLLEAFASHAAQLRAANERIAALTATLTGIANANPLNWDAPHNDTKSFQDWAQSRARAALATNQDKPT